MEIGNILFFGIILVIGILASLYIIEKKIYKSIEKKKNSRNRYYLRKLQQIDYKDQKKSLDAINCLARSFFSEACEIKKSLEYCEIKDFCENSNITKFSSQIETLLYARNEPQKKDIDQLKNLLKEAILKNPILSKEEKALMKEKQKKEEKVGNKFLSKLRKKSNNSDIKAS